MKVQAQHHQEASHLQSIVLIQQSSSRNCSLLTKERDLRNQLMHLIVFYQKEGFQSQMAK